VQLARAVRNRTTGVLYVLDEPSIGLHPYNLKGLTGVMDDLRADGNSVIIVDHDTQVLKHADWMIEMGKGSRSRWRDGDFRGKYRRRFEESALCHRAVPIRSV
jgi:excinuclease UvrABC ATPase subunit